MSSEQATVEVDAKERKPLDQRDLLTRTLSFEEFGEIVDGAPDGIDRAKIRSALEYATKCHGEQKRSSGEPYITHPMGVAAILLSESLDTDAICAALLHDVIEDTGATRQDLETHFGKDVASLVEGVTKIGKLQFTSKAEAQAENLRKMMLAMTSDLRVILIKLADRLHNMSTLKYLPVEKQQRIARESLEIYAPIARRLGISKIQWAIEDTCLRFLNPEVYFDLVRRVNQKRQARESFVDQLKGEMTQVLTAEGIEAEIRGRPKSFYSIYKKTLERDKNLNEIHDLVGIRVLVADVKDCYAALGIIHKTWKPLPGRFKDYIAVPKSNLYQSLHTTVIHPDGAVFEVQIRTYEMDEIAEKGVAAHWAYKEGISASEAARRKMTWFNRLLGWHEDIKDSSQFLEGVKLDLFQDQVFVFTPKGEVIEMPRGATALDFAYHIHTDVGHRCVGVQVNGRMIPMGTVLKNGDVVSVMTSKAGKGPGRDWLEMVTTNRAKNKIRQFLRKDSKDEHRDEGRKKLGEEIERMVKALPADRQLTVPQVLHHEEFAAALAASSFQDLDDLSASIGRGDAQAAQVLGKMPVLQPVREPLTAADVVSKKAPARGKVPGGVLVGGQGDMLVRLSKCCSPMIGDEIVGYITRGRGVSVHRANCPNIVELRRDQDREVPVAWDERVQRDRDATFLAEVEVLVNDQPNVLSRVTNVISSFKVNIQTASARVNKQNCGVLNYGLQIRDSLQLENLLTAIRKLPEVRDVYRVQPGVPRGGRPSGGGGGVGERLL